MSKIESSTSAPTMVPSTAHSQTSLLPSAPPPVVIQALLYNVNNTKGAWSRQEIQCHCFWYSRDA